MSIRIAAILVPLAIAAAPAVADDRPPRYDLDGHCSRLSDTPDGFSPETMTACLVAQGDALEAVRRVWSDTPEYIQRDCDLRARVNRDEDYLILDRCVRDQLRKEQADKGVSTRPRPKPKAKPAPATPPQN